MDWLTVRRQYWLSSSRHRSVLVWYNHRLWYLGNVAVRARRWYDRRTASSANGSWYQVTVVWQCTRVFASASDRERRYPAAGRNRSSSSIVYRADRDWERSARYPVLISRSGNSTGWFSRIRTVPWRRALVQAAPNRLRPARFGVGRRSPSVLWRRDVSVEVDGRWWGTESEQLKFQPWKMNVCNFREKRKKEFSERRNDSWTRLYHSDIRTYITVRVYSRLFLKITCSPIKKFILVIATSTRHSVDVMGAHVRYICPSMQFSGNSLRFCYRRLGNILLLN